MISLAITAIVAGAIYGVYNLFYKQTRVQDLMLEAQQNGRAAIDIMERELINAGLATGDADVITIANAGTIEFVYRDPETDSALSSTAAQKLKVLYTLQTVDGVSYLVRNMGVCSNDTCTTYSNTRNNELVIPYATVFNVTYYNIDGTAVTAAATQADRDLIRFATLELTTRTKHEVPGGGYKTFEVKTHLRLRNIGIGSTATDTSPPTAPAKVEVRDPGTCGTLSVKWTESAEGDVSGYKIYYGTSSTVYTGVIDIPLTAMSGSDYSCSSTGGFMTCTMTPTTPELIVSHSDGSGDVMYYVAVKSYDNSSNHSAISGETSGDSDNADFGTDGEDSTIDAVKLAAVTGFTGVSGADDGEVDLSWTYASGTDVEGFRIYRSTQAFSTYPIDADADAAIEWIAGEDGSGRSSTIDAGDTTFTDDDPSLEGCFTYYYAIAPVNCDATLITDDSGPDDSTNMFGSASDYGITYGDGIADADATNTHNDSPALSDTSTIETVAPAAPVINVSAGWKRVAVALTQPSDSDLSHTCVYVNDGTGIADAYPVVQTDTDTYPLDGVGCYEVDTVTTQTSVGGPTPRSVPDSGGAFDTTDVAVSQSTAFWHDHWSQESPAVPSLEEEADYFYSAVSFDNCGNASPVNDAQASTYLCGGRTDRPPGCRDRP